jgi:hypothetical protein
MHNRLMHRTLCLVISYDFNEAVDTKKRLCNKEDILILQYLFSGKENKIEFISPRATEILDCLSAQHIKKTFGCGNIFNLVISFWSTHLTHFCY